MRLVGPRLGRALQAMAEGGNFILRAVGRQWMGSFCLLCTEMGEELWVEFGAEDRQESGRTKPSGLNPWQWEEVTV